MKRLLRWIARQFVDPVYDAQEAARQDAADLVQLAEAPAYFRDAADFAGELRKLRNDLTERAA
jgi:hypothetical protein